MFPGVSAADYFLRAAGNGITSAVQSFSFP